MRKLLLIAGIILIVVCVFALLLGALFLSGYHNVLDGSAALYAKLHKRAVMFFVISGILAAAAFACFIIRAKT